MRQGRWPVSGLREVGEFAVVLAAIYTDSCAEWKLRSPPYSGGVTSVPMDLAILNGSCGRAAEGNFGRSTAGRIAPVCGDVSV